MGAVLTQCPSSFLLQANINKRNIKVDMKRKMSVFEIYMWHVMVHCNHSRLAEALSDQSPSKRQRGHFPGKRLDVFFACCL